MRAVARERRRNCGIAIPGRCVHRFQQPRTVWDGRAHSCAPAGFNGAADRDAYPGVHAGSDRDARFIADRDARPDPHTGSDGDTCPTLDRDAHPHACSDTHPGSHSNPRAAVCPGP